MPGLVYGVGALGFFALPYTIIVYPLAFVLLPRLWTAARQGGHITVADYVKHRYDSPRLALAVALTGILATMPYIALQLVGIRAVLTAGGVYPRGWAGDLVLVAVFAGLAAATYRHGVRAPAVISLVKGVAIFSAVLVVIMVVLSRVGDPGHIFSAAENNLARGGVPGASLSLSPELFTAFATLALGSALALLMYPHVLTAAFAASGPDTLRRVSIALPAWTAVLGLFGLLGVAALAAGVDAPPGNAEAAVPLLVRQFMPAVLTGVLFGAFAVGALVPAAMMSIAAATLFVRNIYVEYLNPTATPKHQTRVAQLVSLIAKVGAVAFVLGLHNQDAINLRLLGGVWILQTFPAVALGVFTGWLHRGALLAGWVVGMAAGTLMVVWNGFSAVVSVGVGGGLDVPAWARSTSRPSQGWRSGTGGSCTCTATGCSGRSRTPRTPCRRRSSVPGGGGRPSRGGRRSGPGCTGSPPTPAWTCSPSAARSPRPAARCCGCSPTRTGCSTSCPRATRTSRRPSPSRGRRSSWRTWSRSSTSRRARGAEPVAHDRHPHRDAGSSTVEAPGPCRRPPRR